MRAAAARTSSRLIAYWAACLSGAMTHTRPTLWPPVRNVEANTCCDTCEKRGMLASWCLGTQPSNCPRLAVGKGTG